MKRTTRITTILSIVVIIVGQSVHCGAKTLEEGREIYKEELAAIEQGFKSNRVVCLAYYSNSLTRIERKFREDADLEGLIAVRREMERFGNSGTVPERTPDGTPDPIAIAQSEYHRLISRAEVNKLRKHAALARSYAKSLEALKVRLTKQGDLDEALRVVDEVKSAEFILADVEVQLESNDVRARALQGPREPRRRESGKTAKMYISCDNEYVVWLNGKRIGSCTDWHVLACYPIRIAENDILAIEAKDLESGDHLAGLFCGIVIDGDNRSWGTGPDWHCSTARPPSDWRTSSMLQFDQKMSTENIHPTHRDRERAFLATNQYITGDIVWSPKPSPVVYVKETISFSRFAGGGK